MGTENWLSSSLSQILVRTYSSLGKINNNKVVKTTELLNMVIERKTETNLRNILCCQPLYGKHKRSRKNNTNTSTQIK